MYQCDLKWVNTAQVRWRQAMCLAPKDRWPSLTGTHTDGLSRWALSSGPELTFCPAWCHQALLHWQQCEEAIFCVFWSPSHSWLKLKPAEEESWGAKLGIRSHVEVAVWMMFVIFCHSIAAIGVRPSLVSWDERRTSAAPASLLKGRRWGVKAHSGSCSHSRAYSGPCFVSGVCLSHGSAFVIYSEGEKLGQAPLLLFGQELAREAHCL